MTGWRIDARHARPLPFVMAWIVMLLLAGVSLWTAFLALGIWAPILQFGIAAIQTAILFVLFMRLKVGTPLKWIFAVSGFFWLLFLYGLSMTDYSNRQGWPPTHISGPTIAGHQNPRDRARRR